MEELKFKFGWRMRIRILFGKTMSLFIDRKIVGTYTDSKGDTFVELRDKPKVNKKELACLFG